MRLHGFLLATAVALILTGPSTQASVRRQHVELKVRGAPRAASAGEIFAFTIELRAAASLTLTNLHLEGEGWTGGFLDAPRELSLAAQAPVELRFEAVPRDPDVPLVLAYNVDGEPVREILDFSPRNIETMLRPGRSVTLETGDRVPFPGEAQARTAASPSRPSPGQLGWESRVEEKPADRPQGLRDIRVHGRIVYERQEDGRTIGADGIRVLIMRDSGAPMGQELAQLYADENGYYDVTFPWAQDYDPDLYVAYRSYSLHAEVEVYLPYAPYYEWASGVVENVSGSSLYMGWMSPADEAEHPALHVLTNLTHAWRWFDSYDYNTPTVHARWPYTGASNNSFYLNGVIYVADEQEWDEDTQIHEYGHHWVYEFGAASSSGYCNEICDPVDLPCRHCDWCEEEPEDAWNEGFSDWVADVVTRDYASMFGIASLNFRGREELGDCIEMSFSSNAGATCLCDPWKTEGFLSALLCDIEDTTQDNDPRAPGAWTDALALGPGPILTIAADNPRPDTPLEFLTKFYDGYPQYREALWETGMNATYDLDATAPGAPASLTSSSHDPSNPASPDATIRYTWSRPADDWSGVGGYGIFVSLNTPSTPSTVQDIGNVTEYTTTALAPGVYYFNIRAVDRAGRWSVTSSYGPIDIRAREPVDLVVYPRPGWADVLVPRPTNDATISVVAAPATLNGNSNSTYWNFSGRNTGDDATSVGFDTHLLLDGAFSRTASWGGPLPAMAAYQFLNLGPLSVRGGRHTFEAVLEAGEDIHEGDENNNLWAHQWIWSPLALTENAQVNRVLPPDRIGGHDAIVDGSTIYPNSDGLRFSATDPWNAVWVYATDNTDDYDCRLHTGSTGPTNGFGAYLGWSSRAAGCLDVVLLQRSIAGVGPWDVGVIDYNPTHDFLGTGYRAKLVGSQSVLFGDSVSVTLPANEMLLLREFRIFPGDVGPVTITLQADPAAGPLHIRWFDDTFSRGDLDDEDGQATTDATGRARIDFVAAQPGYNCVAVFRDPKDGTAALTAMLEIESTLPDYVPVLVTGWHAPLVPRPAADGVPASVPPPVTLAGNAPSTYFNFAFVNASLAAAPGMTSHTALDGVATWTVVFGGTAAGATHTFNSGTARNVRGGRHTIAMRLDGPGATEEREEGNNVYGEQWVWSPLAVPAGNTTNRTAPPERIGGWTEISTSEPRWFNCDGLRTPVFAPSGANGYWAAVAVMPRDTSDVDVRLHELDAGVNAGFAANLGLSAWGVGQSDFVLADFRLTAFRAFDAGVLRGDGVQSYDAQVATSTRLGDFPVGPYGPFTLHANRIVSLHEMSLQAGQNHIHLENTSGTVDWGMSLYGGTTAFFAKSDVVTDGAAWFGGPGEDERIVAVVPSNGDYCLAVWKVHDEDLAAAGSYVLHFVGDVTDNQQSHAWTTRLMDCAPNPFRGATAIAFELATAAPVQLEVFDVRGARVRSLLHGERPSGRHTLAWDGRDAAGRRVASGVYIVRFTVDGRRATQRVVLSR